MSRSIEVSPKHGLNPTIPVCFWCGKEKNEIALMGRVREKDHNGRAVRGSDVEMPMKAVLDYEPCECCKTQFSQGVQIIECVDHVQDGRPPISKDDKGNKVFPTGRTLVFRPEAAQNIFNVDKSMLEAGKKLCLDDTMFGQLLDMVQGSQSDNI